MTERGQIWFFDSLSADLESELKQKSVSGASMNQEYFIEFESIELGCDQQLLKELEAKNYVKIDVY